MGSSDWVVFFTICSLQTYIFLEFLNLLFFRSSLLSEVKSQKATNFIFVLLFLKSSWFERCFVCLVITSFDSE